MSRYARIYVVFSLLLPLMPLSAIAADPQLSDDMNSALNDLGFQDHANRIHSLKIIDDAFIGQTVLLFQNDDTETTAGIDEALHFQQNLSAWLQAVDRLPSDARQQQLKLIQSSEMKAIAPQLFSSNSSIQIQGIHHTGQLKSEGVDRLLGYFLNDKSTDVALAVMETFWDRPPTADGVDVVWEMAIESRVSGAMEPFPQSRPPRLNFRGQPLLPRYTTLIVYGVDSDARVQAGQMLLTHWSGPDVTRRLKGSFNEVATKLQHLGPNVPAPVNSVHEPMLILSEIATGAKTKPHSRFTALAPSEARAH